MNPEKLLNDAAAAIKARPFSYSLCYHLCWTDGKIQCLPCSHAINPHPIFLACKGASFEDGLTIKQWAFLQNKLTHFFKERI